MTAAALGVAWAGWVVATWWRRRPGPRRVRALVPRFPPAHLRPRRSPAAAVGAVVLAIAGRAAGREQGALPPALELRVGRTLLAAGPALALHPLAALATAVGTWSLPVLAARRARTRHVAAVRRHLPEAVDLLSLAVGAGMNVPLAVAAVARRSPGPVAAALAVAVRQAAAGRRLGDGLADLPASLGEDVRPLVAALVSSERYGTSAAERLDRLAAELRTERRRRAEEAARRVPVKLLFPLVCCILPAFALLTVAPLLAGALSALRP